jgi:hypothetical protein
LHGHFDRDQHDSLIKRLFHIKQIGSVQEYIDKFSELVDQLVAYEDCSDRCYFTTCFADGLKHDIKFVVLIQCPTNLDTACALPLLQEEVDSAWRKELKRNDLEFKPKSATLGTPLPLPLPPPDRINHWVEGSLSVECLMRTLLLHLTTRLLHFVLTGVPEIFASIVRRSGLEATNVGA